MQEKPWDADATFPGGQCSRDVLLAWLAARENYTRWHYGRGAARAALVRRIAVEIQLLGLPVRTTREVRAQIDVYETNMRKAVEWKVRYGDQILQRRAGDPSAAAEVRAGIMRICPEYDTLAPAMLELLETELENSTANTPYSISKKKKPAPPAAVATTAAATTTEVRSAPTSRRSSPTNPSPPRAQPSPQPPSRVEDEHDAVPAMSHPPTIVRTDGAAVGASSSPRRTPLTRSRPPPAAPANTAPTTRSHIPRSPVQHHDHTATERRANGAVSQRRYTPMSAPMAITSITSPASPLVRVTRSRSPPARRSQPTQRSRSRSPPLRRARTANEDSTVPQQRRSPDEEPPLPPRPQQSQAQPQPRPQPQQAQPQPLPLTQPPPHPQSQTQHQQPPSHQPEPHPHLRSRMRLAVANDSTTATRHHYPDEHQHPDAPLRMVVNEPPPRRYAEIPTHQQQQQSRPAHPASSAPTVVAPPRPPPSPPSTMLPADLDYERVDPMRLQRDRERSISEDANSETSVNPALDALLHQVEVDRLQYERRCQAMREERLQLDLARQRIQVTKEKALARHELRLAGVPEYEIDRAFPL